MNETNHRFDFMNEESMSSDSELSFLIPALDEIGFTIVNPVIPTNKNEDKHG